MCSEVAAGAVITQRRGSLHRLLIYHKHVIFHFKIHMNSDRRSALQSTVRCRTPVIHCLFICVRRYSQYSSSVPCDTSSSLVTHHTVDRVDMLTGTRWPDKLAAAMCCVVCLCCRCVITPMWTVRFLDNPGHCSVESCCAGPGAAYTYTLVHSVHPHQLLSYL